MKTVIIDNYDSFTYNLFQQVAKLSGVEPIVVKNDELTFAQLMDLKADNFIISPGPGRPEKATDFGICKEVILKTTQPILGVCLGLQGIVHFLGGQVVHAPEPFHGRLTPVFHNNSNLFKGIPQGFKVVRYHSLIVGDLPKCLNINAVTAEGIVMGIEHKEKPMWGVQFHPESISTEYGDQIIENFLELATAPT